MNRQIKFKGKKVLDNEWIYSNSIYWQNETLGLIPYFFDHSLKDKVVHFGDCWIEVIPETISQFTELYDGTEWGELSVEEKRNFLDKHESEWKGIEIYEGDILKGEPSVINEKDYRLYEVFYYDFWLQFCCYEKVDIGYSKHNIFPLADYDLKRFKVIGHIYDNPTLSKRKKI